MNLGEIARNRLHVLSLIAAILALVAVPQASFAAAATQATESSAAAPVADAVSPNVADETLPVAEAAEGSTAEAATSATPGYTPLGPDMIKGQPEPGGLNFQRQYSEDGEWALWMHDAFLLPMMVGVSLLVLFLLLWVVAKYNRRANPVPSKTSHNTVIEVIWTVVPVLILVAIAIPSIALLAR